MIKVNLIFLTALLLCLNYASALYIQRAQEFLAQLVVENPSNPLADADLKDFLQERFSKAQTLLKGGSQAYDLLESETKILDPKKCLEIVEDDLESNPHARAFYFYAELFKKNQLSLIRQRLRCRVSDQIADFEKPYEDTLVKVSPAEFQKRFHAIPQDEFNTIFFQCSKDFAEAILAELDKKSNV